MPSDPLDAITFDVGALNDPPPGPPPGTRRKPGRPKGSRNKPKSQGAPASRSVTKTFTDAELRASLEEALVMPAIPSMMFYPTVEGKMYLSSHFAMAAPWGADKLVRLSKQSPSLRRILENIAKGGMAGLAITFGVVYFGGPALYIAGQRNLAESVTMMTQEDESAMRKMVEAMLSSAGNAVPPQSPPDHAGATGPSVAESQGGEQFGPPPDATDTLS